MTATESDTETIKKLVAQRAREFGDRISPREVLVEFMPGEVAPGCRLFRAWWGAGEAQGSLAGLLRDREPPDTYPAQALGKVFQRWLDTLGTLPDARHVAAVSAFLYDAAGRHRLILSDAEAVELVDRPDWLSYVRPPEMIEVEGQPGVVFWWLGRRGPSEMRVYLVRNSEIRTDERFVQDMTAAEGLE